jgi:hypothetical protein
VTSFLIGRRTSDSCRNPTVGGCHHDELGRIYLATDEECPRLARVTASAAQFLSEASGIARPGILLDRYATRVGTIYIEEITERHWRGSMWLRG